MTDYRITRTDIACLVYAAGCGFLFVLFLSGRPLVSLLMGAVTGVMGGTITLILAKTLGILPFQMVNVSIEQKCLVLVTSLACVVYFIYGYYRSGETLLILVTLFWAVPFISLLSADLIRRCRLE